MGVVEVAEAPLDVALSVADPAEVSVRVTPTDSQVAWANAIAAWRSSPVQVDWMHDAVLVTNCWLLQRHTLSVAEQSPVSAVVMHVKAQAKERRC